MQPGGIGGGDGPWNLSDLAHVSKVLPFAVNSEHEV
jgi:hypothetical protein